MQPRINDLLQKRMDRKSFLKHVGIGMVALTGLSSAFKLIKGNQLHAVSSGYGGSAYGGNPKMGATRQA